MRVPRLCRASAQTLVDAGLTCLLPELDAWREFLVGDIGSMGDEGRNVEVYLQRWPADKKVTYHGVLEIEYIGQIMLCSVPLKAIQSTTQGR